MKITKNGDGTYTYERKTKNRIWDDKMYFFPIPQSERSKNPNLEQKSGMVNPGCSKRTEEEFLNVLLN